VHERGESTSWRGSIWQPTVGCAEMRGGEPVSPGCGHGIWVLQPDGLHHDLSAL